MILLVPTLGVMRVSVDMFELLLFVNSQKSLLRPLSDSAALPKRNARKLPLYGT